MKTDSIFYRLFQEFPSIFFELIGHGSSEAIEYEFTSVEVKQLAFRMDGLFLPKTKDISQPFYIVEVQFQPDDNLYYRLFSELFLYLKQYQPSIPWMVVVIYPKRSVEREQELHFGYLLASPQVQRIYLDELVESANTSLGVGVVKLVIETEEKIAEKAKVLIERAKIELEDEVVKGNLIELIETIIIYKLPKKSREEIEAMLGLSELKQTKVYQEAQLEAKLEAVPELLKEGLEIEQIARALKLPLKVVQQAVQKQKSDN
ncbi:MAG: Rpn family recombination-promoting nuclease/putative transposase [Xenococcaceae cyanobacterium]